MNQLSQNRRIEIIETFKKGYSIRRTAKTCKVSINTVRKLLREQRIQQRLGPGKSNYYHAHSWVVDLGSREPKMRCSCGHEKSLDEVKA